MYNCDIPQRQLTAWLAAATIPTSIQLLAGCSWVSVLLVSVVGVLLCWIARNLGTEPKGKLIAIMQWGLLTSLLGKICQLSLQSWPRGAHPVVAVVLLALALWSVLKGVSAPARVGSVLFWFVLLLYTIVIGAGVKEIQLSWLSPSKGDVDAVGCILLLSPVVAFTYLYKEKEKRQIAMPRLLLVGAFCIIASVVTAGVLAPWVAAEKENAFYEMVRSLNIAGQARRFESVLSAGMTVGWFSLITLFLSLCAKLAESVHTGYGRMGASLAVVVALLILLCDLHIPGWLMLILTAVFWVLVPLLTQGLEQIKKSKKSKKRS